MMRPFNLHHTVLGLVILFVLTVVPSVAQNTGTVSPMKAEIVNVKTSVNIRSGAGSSHPSVGKIPNGSTVDVLNSDKAPWILIEYNGLRGYVFDKYIDVKADAPASGKEELKEQGAKNAFGHTVPLKWCFIIILVLAFCNLCLTINSHSDVRLMPRLTWMVIFNGMLILTYFSHDTRLLVDNHWTGGWLNGYAMAFVNSLLMAFLLYVEYRVYHTVCYGIALTTMGEEQCENFHPKKIFWYTILVVIVTLALALLLPLAFWIPGVMYLVFIIKQIRLFHPQYHKALAVFLLSLLTLCVCAILMYTFIKMLVLGVLAIFFSLAFIKALPEAASETMKDYERMNREEEAKRQNQNTNTEPQDDYDMVIEKGGTFGEDVKAKSGYFGTAVDEHGRKWEKNSDGTYSRS